MKQLEAGRSGLDSASLMPLMVDLDGSILNSDLLLETLFGFLSRRPLSLFRVPWWLRGGRAGLKHRLADQVQLDVANLPYNQAVVAYVEAARAAGRSVYLVSASDERLVQQVAEHLGLFDGWFASDGIRNLSGRAKAEFLVAQFGNGQFDYIGNEDKDLEVWRHANRAIAVGASAGLRHRLSALDVPADYLEAPRPSLKTYAKLLRVHQWLKNALIAVPMLTSHQISLTNAAIVVLAFASFSACASSVYVVNDLLDLTSDRRHPTKRFRPFASGTVPIANGLIIAPLLIALSALIASFVSLPFLAVLITYFISTTAYSFYLKRKMLVDVVTLAGLYCIRVFAGAVAINVPVSEWIIGFSMFMFLSLALLKRYSELAMLFDRNLPNPTNRNYMTSDLPAILSMAAAAGYSAVIVFALYVSSTAVKVLYVHPDVLWLACPALLYWVSRAVMLCHRRMLDDDPVIFAMRDRNSWMVAGVIAVLGVMAQIHTRLF